MSVRIIIPTLDFQAANRTARNAIEVAGRYATARIYVDINREGFTRTVNRGIRDIEDGDYVCLLNDDCRLSQDWLYQLRYEMDQRRSVLNVGFAGPSGRCRTPPQNSGREFDNRRPSLVPHLAGFCLLMHPDAVQELDERFTHYGSDVALQWSSELRSLWVPRVYCDHELHPPREPWWTEDNRKLAKIFRGRIK